MCPYKKITTRKKVTPWITPETYRAIREKRHHVKNSLGRCISKLNDVLVAQVEVIYYVKQY